LCTQTEKAFQKQSGVFLNAKKSARGGKARFYKDVGLGFKTPKEAIEVEA
jgi:small subunit ribosomal protein S11e